MENKEELCCRHCGRKAYEIDEYINQAAEEKTTPEAIARTDGTYNYKVNKFLCTSCYIKCGMPSQAEIFRQDERMLNFNLLDLIDEEVERLNNE